MKLNEYAKAVAAAAVGFLGQFDAATAVGSPGAEGVTVNEWIRLVVVTVAAGIAVFLIPNSKPDESAASEPVAYEMNVSARGVAPARAPEDYRGEHGRY